MALKGDICRNHCNRPQGQCLTGLSGNKPMRTNQGPITHGQCGDLLDNEVKTKKQKNVMLQNGNAFELETA